MLLEQRAYQDAALERVREQLRAGNTRTVVAAPTGSGKTVIATRTIASAIDKDSRVLFVAHRRELIRQPFAKLIRYGIAPSNIGIIMAGIQPAKSDPPLPPNLDSCLDSELWEMFARRRPAAQVQIASVDTIRNRPKPDADLIIIDEAHRALCKSYVDLLAQYPPTTKVLGLTATPIRMDRRGLREVFDSLVVVAQYLDLVELGYLVEPRVFTVPRNYLPDLSGVKTRLGDYDQAELERRCNKSTLVGNIVDHWLRKGQGSPTLVFASGIDHSRAIQVKFLSAGIKAAHVDGNTPSYERDAITDKLTSGEIQVVCNCDVLTEGVDIPAIKTIVLARPTKSVRVYLQQCGRGSRPYPNSKRFVILDHAGCVNAHGMPQENREWSLDPPPKRTRATQQMAPVRICPECLCAAPLSSKTCPECGYEFEPPGKKQPREVSGELEERTLTSDNKNIRLWNSIVLEWYERNATRSGPPIKPGWCFYQYQLRYKRMPPKGYRLPKPIPTEDFIRDEQGN